MPYGIRRGTFYMLPRANNVRPYSLYDGENVFWHAEAPSVRGLSPQVTEGERLAIARNISDSRTVLSPTACGRSPLAEGAKG